MTKLNQKKGITLIALVVTIIILLILSSVVMALLIENGLFEKAKLAKEKTEKAQNESDAILEGYANLIGNYIVSENTTKQIFAEEVYFTSMNTNWKVDNVKDALDYLYNN